MRPQGLGERYRQKLALIRAKPARRGPVPTPVPPSDDEMAGFYRRFAGVTIGAPLETPPSDGDGASVAVTTQALALGQLRDGELQATYESTLKAAEGTPTGVTRRDLLERGLSMLRMEAVRRGLLFTVPTANAACRPPSGDASGGNPRVANAGERPRRRTPIVAAREGLAGTLQPFFANHAAAARNVEWALAEEGLAAVLRALEKGPERFGKPSGRGPRGPHGELDSGVEAAVRALAGLVPPRAAGQA